MYFKDLEETTDYLNFIIKIIKNEITASTYSERLDNVMKYLQPELQPPQNGKTAP